MNKIVKASLDSGFVRSIITLSIIFNAPTPAQGVGPTDSKPISSSQGGEAEQAFFQMMSEWFTESVRTNPAAQQPPPYLFLNKFPLCLKC
ncbi:hypothetical protein F383_24513 [Gossypium arboreum]|uniref:Uncharacterized protein n=1 Tax=Gossypium arboreum TaxID=29729 RepID=A0A0B0P7F6_GOSAR|nr:hypothetical protein F383_24513 [Gossypium arboreum]